MVWTKINSDLWQLSYVCMLVIPECILLEEGALGVVGIHSWTNRLSDEWALVPMGYLGFGIMASLHNSMATSGFRFGLHQLLRPVSMHL